MCLVLLMETLLNLETLVKLQENAKKEIINESDKILKYFVDSIEYLENIDKSIDERLIQL